MRTSIRITLLLTLCFLPVACGGGGVADLILSAQNANTVAAQGVESVDLLAEMSGLTEGLSQVFELGTETVVPCTSGTHDVVVNDLPPVNEISTGDSAIYTFNACVIDAGGETLTVDGRVTLEATEVTGSEPGPFTRKLRVTFDSFSMVAIDGTVIVDGGFLLEASSTDGVTNEARVSGSSIHAFVQNGLRTESVTITDFLLVLTNNETTGAFTGELQATVSGSNTGGKVTFATPTPFSGIDGNDPDTGEFVVTGAAGATLTLLVVDDVNIQLLLDLDANGTPEVTLNTTWDALDN